MDLDLQGKGALVTGGGESIGKAVAWALAKEGVDVAICARRQEELEKTAKEIAESTGRNIVPIAADMGSYDDVQRFVKQAADRLGKIDILVNNAGAAPPGFLMSIPDEAFLTAVHVKLLGYIRCARAVVPYMRQQGGGTIIMIAGTSGRQPTAGMATAGVANAGVINFTKSMADAVALENIRVISICPSLVQTRRGELVEQAAEQLETLAYQVGKRLSRNNIPLGRVADVGEIADTVLFLTSKKAGFISGVSISVDGGFTQAAF